MESVRETYLTLKSPELVAKFQNYFGIELDDRPSTCRGENESQSVQTDKGHDGQLRNGIVHRHSNGFVKSDDCVELKQKNGFVNGNICEEEIRTKNGFCANGVIHNGSVQNGFVDKPQNTQFSNEISETKSSYRIKSWFWYLVFSLGASLGNEMFYITFFPFLIWNVDSTLLRRMAFVWHLAMWWGQAAKDIICWPRPASPPVIKLENRYGLEYGMPSTHSLVGAVIPFCLLILGSQVYEVRDFKVKCLHCMMHEFTFCD